MTPILTQIERGGKGFPTKELVCAYIRTLKQKFFAFANIELALGQILQDKASS